MDRTFWLSLVVVLLSVALLVSGRALLEGSKWSNGAQLVAEIEALDGRPSTVEMADRVTAAAGCIRGNRPEVFSCWYVWVDPTRPDYLMVTAKRARDDRARAAMGWAAPGALLWLLLVPVLWKATRPRAYFQAAALKPIRAERPASRLMP